MAQSKAADKYRYVAFQGLDGGKTTRSVMPDSLDDLSSSGVLCVAQLVVSGSSPRY